MKSILFTTLAVCCLWSSLATASLLSSVAANCQVQQVSTSDAQDGAVVATMACQNGTRFELKQVALASGSCSSSFWCSGMEHCVGGKCVPKDFFNQCDMFHSCSFGDKCVGGVCKH